MLTLHVPAEVLWDPAKEEFIHTEERVIQLEHSLVSLAKWESKWKKPFLSNESKTEEEIIDYLRCMCLNEEDESYDFRYIPSSCLKEIRDYIDDSMTATTFHKPEGAGGRREIVTAEIIYYWLVALEIPFEVQYWHLNRLLTLVNVCNEKQKPARKMRRSDILANNKALNAARRARLGTTG